MFSDTTSTNGNAGEQSNDNGFSTSNHNNELTTTSSPTNEFRPRSNPFHSGLTHDYRYRDQMYRMIISQMFYDGQAQLAKNIASVMGIVDMCPPSDRLFNTVTKSMIANGEPPTSGKTLRPTVGMDLSLSGNYQLANGIDLDFETERSPASASLAPSSYETVYVTSHKGPCRTGCFSQNGQLVATGSVDASIKILDVERMIAKSYNNSNNNDKDQQSNDQSGHQSSSETHPVIRTLYDHLEEVSCLVFHPRDQFLISGSHDMTIKIFDYSKPSVKRACKSVQESHIVRCLAIHPTGEYLLVGTKHPTVRLYHLPTFQSFISPVAADQHKAPITAINYSPNAQIYASSSKDGDIRLWDTVSNRCVGMLPRAHEGFEICSVEFSRNGKYLLSSGKDSMVKLWELSMLRCLIAYTGAGQNLHQPTTKHRSQASFNHTEDYVLLPDEMSNSLCVWDARNAERQSLLALGHNHPVRQLCHSPIAPAFLTCSDDFRARFWYNRSADS